MAWLDLQEGVLEEFADRTGRLDFAEALSCGLTLSDGVGAVDRWLSWATEHTDSVRTSKREWARKARASMTAQERDARNKYQRERYWKSHPEALVARRNRQKAKRRKLALYDREWLAKMSPDERVLYVMALRAVEIRRSVVAERVRRRLDARPVRRRVDRVC